MNKEDMTLNVVALTKKVGSWIFNEVNRVNENNVEYKGVHNLVTYVDKTAEEMLISELKNLIPEAGFIAEEDDQLQKAKRFNWIVDPLDGTTNFIHKVPLYSISIALMDEEDVVLGVVHEINLKESFFAWKGGGAFLNDKPIRVADTSDLDQSLLATGFPYYDYNRLDEYMDLFKDMMKSSRGVRRLGSAAVDLAYVACGRFELFYEYGLNPWDVAAGAFIVQQAGGEISTFSGDDNYIFGREIVASNGKIHKEFMKKLNVYFH